MFKVCLLQLELECLIACCGLLTRQHVTMSRGDDRVGLLEAEKLFVAL